MTDENEPFRRRVNRAGYAFSMAVASRVEEGFRSPWELAGVEVPWLNRSGERGGFVDIVIQCDSAIGVIECKNPEKERLIFLTRHDYNPSETRCRLDVYEAITEDHRHMGSWYLRKRARGQPVECRMANGSPESIYCVSQNRDLDGIASELLDSCEGLLGDWRVKVPGPFAACIPIIVTSAPLVTCEFDPFEIDVETGDLPTDTRFTAQKFVRFRKPFRIRAPMTQLDEIELGAVAPIGERTVFVVNSGHLEWFLEHLRALTTAPGVDPARAFVRG